MAICRICGNKNPWIDKDNTWTEWECDKCFSEQMSESAGQLSPEEKFMSNDSHAWPHGLANNEVR
jgi:hypothetical protein